MKSSTLAWMTNLSISKYCRTVAVRVMGHNARECLWRYNCDIRFYICLAQAIDSSSLGVGPTPQPLLADVAAGLEFASK